MIGKRLIIVGADYSDVSIGKLKISITSTKLSDGETATLTLSAPSVTATTLKAETSGSTITMTGSNPYTITAGSTEGTQEITCTLTYTDTTGKSVTETKKLTITVGEASPTQIVWHTTEYNTNELNKTANITYAGFSWMDSARGTETTGSKFNRVRFTLHTAGTITVGVVDSTGTQIIASEVLNITGSTGDLIVAKTNKTYTLASGQRFFIGQKTDTLVFKYAYPANTKEGKFYAKQGYEGNYSCSNQNLSVDFGYQA